jgi:hypothetical protein
VNAAVRDGQLDSLGQAIVARDEQTAMRLLTAIKGVGPIVARTAWTLLMATSTPNNDEMRDRR